MKRSKFNNHKGSKEFLDYLENRFLKGEVLTIRDLVEEESPSSFKSPLSYLLAEKKLRGFMVSLKYRFEKQGFAFGAIDELGHYGIMNTPSKSRHYIMRRYHLTKSILRKSQLASSFAQRDGLLPKIDKENIDLPKLEENKNI